MFRRTRALCVVAALATVGLLSGCGGTPAGTSLTRVTLGTMPGADLAPLHLAADEGIFASHGLDVRFDTLASSTQGVLEAVAYGRYDFGYADFVSIMAASEGGRAVTVVSGAAATSGNPLGDFAALLVPENSTMTSVADLTGGTIAVDALGGAGRVVVESLLAGQGVDTATITWQEVQAVGAVDALTAGRADAALVPEPFATAARIDGMRALAFPYAVFNKSLTVTGFVAATGLPAETLDSFAAAIDEALAFATEHQTETRDHIAASVDAGSQVRTRVRLPVFTTRVDPAALEQLAAAAVLSGALASEPPLDDFLP